MWVVVGHLHGAVALRADALDRESHAAQGRGRHHLTQTRRQQLLAAVLDRALVERLHARVGGWDTTAA